MLEFKKHPLAESLSVFHNVLQYHTKISKMKVKEIFQMTSKLVDHTENPELANLKQFRFEFETLDLEPFESSDSDE